MVRSSMFVFCILYSIITVKSETKSWRAQNNAKEYDTLSAVAFRTALDSALIQEKRLKEEIAKEQARIEETKQRYENSDRKLAACTQELYSFLGITKEDIVLAEKSVANMNQKAIELSGIENEELTKRSAELVDLKAVTVQLRSKPIARLQRIDVPLKECEESIARLSDRIMTATNTKKKSSAVSSASAPSKGEKIKTTYTVKNLKQGWESLSSIAARTEVYGDSTLWQRLYEANKEIIDNGYKTYLSTNSAPRYSHPSDLILPGQILQIPR